MERLIRQSLAATRATRNAGLAFQVFLLVLVSVHVGRLASTGEVGPQILALLLLGAVAAALAAPPHVFVAVALLVFGSFSISDQYPLAFGGTTVFSTDVLLFVVLLRALLPKERIPPPARLGTVVRVLFGLWALVMILAGLRGVLEGSDLVSVVRLETPLIYGVGFYVGLGRIMRERDFEVNKACRNLLLVALGFVGWMMLARATNHPFETEETVGRLGSVVTNSGAFRRDYGFASAFIVYPALALAGAAYLLYGPRRIALAAAVAGIGTIATLLTLIRAEIFGLFVGLAVIAVLRNESTLRRVARVQAIVVGAMAFTFAGLVLWAVNPALASGIVERSLPGLVSQTEAAESTAEYRQQALDVGLAAAEEKPMGLGLVSAEALGAAGIDFGHLAHSGPATMLVYAGWVGLIAVVLALIALLWASFLAPRPVPWLHPFFVGLLLMLIVYSFGANGLVGQGWVVALGALVAALRFNAVGTSP